MNGPWANRGCFGKLAQRVLGNGRMVIPTHLITLADITKSTVEIDEKVDETRLQSIWTGVPSYQNRHLWDKKGVTKWEHRSRDIKRNGPWLLVWNSTPRSFPVFDIKTKHKYCDNWYKWVSKTIEYCHVLSWAQKTHLCWIYSWMYLSGNILWVSLL